MEKCWSLDGSAQRWRCIDMRKIETVLYEMDMIVKPGEYGLGTEKESIPDDDKKAWERLAELSDEMGMILYKVQQRLDEMTERVNANPNDLVAYQWQNALKWVLGVGK